MDKITTTFEIKPGTEGTTRGRGAIFEAADSNGTVAEMSSEQLVVWLQHHMKTHRLRKLVAVTV